MRSPLLGVLALGFASVLCACRSQPDCREATITVTQTTTTYTYPVAVPGPAPAPVAAAVPALPRKCGVSRNVDPFADECRTELAAAPPAARATTNHPCTVQRATDPFAEPCTRSVPAPAPQRPRGALLDQAL